MKNNIIIIGCGRLGSGVANTLYSKNINVTIIDREKTSFRKLSSGFGGLIVEGDGTDIELLKKQDIEKVNMVIVVTENDNTNIMVAQMVKNIFNVPSVITRLYNPEKKEAVNEGEIEFIFPSVIGMDIINRIILKKEDE